MKAIPFREQSCVHKSPGNSAISISNFTLKLPFCEAEGQNDFLFFDPYAFLRAYLELPKEFPKCPTKSFVGCPKHI